MSDPHTPLERAVSICGGQKKLADAIGVTQSMVWYWLAKSKDGVPAKYCAAIESATSGVITRADLRPDIFGDAA